MPKTDRELDAAVTIDDERRAITFTFPADDDAGLPEYRDTLYVDADTPDKELRTLRLERYKSWRAAILNPPEPEAVDPPDPAELIAAAVTDAETALARLRDLVVGSGIELAAPVVSSAGMNRQQRRALERATG